MAQQDWSVQLASQSTLRPRVAVPGRADGYPTGPPTDPDVRNARIRFLGSQSVGTTLAHHFAALQTTQMVWTILGVGNTSIASRFWHFSPSIALVLLRRLNQYRHAFSA